jgi:hypothetical protein
VRFILDFMCSLVHPLLFLHCISLNISQFIHAFVNGYVVVYRFLVLKRVLPLKFFFPYIIVILGVYCDI